MPRSSSPEMLVILDADPNSLAPLTIAQRYATGTVLLASWNADPLEIAAVVQSSATAEPTVPEALQAAAHRGIPWVGIRRDFASPKQLLTDLLVATARHADDTVPGFAVFLAAGEPPPFRHILAIVDRSHGPISGLLAYAAVAVADSAGAQLDILIIGDVGEDPHTEDELGDLAISREQELYDAAVERARAEGLQVNWITAASVATLWPVIVDQLSQHDYDLVIDDLGDVSLARVRLRDTVDNVLADGEVGEVPLKLLTETTLPLLLVIDEIRLGLAPVSLLKAGAMAALALGVVAAPVAAAAAAPALATSTTDHQDPIADLVADLESALDGVDAERTEEQRVEDATDASRGTSTEGARAEAEQAVPQPTAYAPQAAAVPTGAQTAAAEAQGLVQSEDKASSEPKPPKPPKGGATPTDVAKAERAAAKDKAALEKDKEQKATSKEAVAAAEADLVEAEAAAAAALAGLEAATQSHTAAADHAEATKSATTGIAALLPGTPTEEQVAAALLAEQAAAAQLAAAVASGEQSLAALVEAEEALAEEQATLEERTADVQETKAEYAHSKAKAEVFKESLAETRQAPMAKGSYRLTARFGQTGGYWSSGVHTGLDFAGPTGTPIMAAASGKVVSTGYQGAYGNQIVIDHGDGYQTTYNHLSAVGVSVGDRVSTGDQIGRRGSTGNSTGAHLHFEVTKEGKFIDPEAWLGW